MSKKLMISSCLMFVICFVGYSQTVDNTENLTKWAEIYRVTLDSYLKLDSALNKNIEFIAIDFTTLEFINDYDKNEIIEWFENHHVPVIDTNFNGLRERGLFNEQFRYIINGVLLRIDQVTETNNEIIIYGSKYRSSQGANWFRTNWRLNNGNWEWVRTAITGIS